MPPEQGLPVLEYTAATTKLIHTGKAILYSIHMSADDADGDCQLYDGMGTSGKQLLHIEAIDGYNHQITWRRGIKINLGIYLVANAATTKCTIEYDPID